MARATDPTNRYRRAWQAGNEGRTLPKGLADLADSDPKIDAAFDAGQGGTDYDTFARENGLSAPAPKSSGSSSSSSSSTRGSSKSSSPSHSLFSDGSSIIVGLFATAMILSIVDYGPKGPLLWFKAKFLNQAATKPGSVPKSTASSAPTVTPAVSTAITSGIFA